MLTSPNSQPEQCYMLLLITQVLSSVDCLTACSSPAQPSECPRLCQSRCVFAQAATGLRPEGSLTLALTLSPAAVPKTAQISIIFIACPRTRSCISSSRPTLVVVHTPICEQH